MIAKQENPYDVIIVGAGFGGCYLLNEVRKAGFKVILLEEASDIGGVWYWNTYDGARTDSCVPLYEYSDPEIWNDWKWTEKYPHVAEIQDYFHHVDSKLHLKRDIKLDSRVEKAQFNENSGTWTVSTSAESFEARFFILATGFASKPLFPEVKGLETFKAQAHTSKWPRDGFNFKGKRVGIIGNGASGIQVIQEIAKDVDHMSVFQRTPTYALPMRQEKLDKGQKLQNKEIFEHRNTTFGGLERDFNPQSALEVSDEERERFFEQIWTEGGPAFWLYTYRDILTDPIASEHAYNFWRKKVIQRIERPHVAEILAPERALYHFGTKRATLEQTYYEVYNRSNVSLIDLRSNPIKEVVPEGIITADATLHALDILVLATGFDSVTGGILAIDIRGKDEQRLEDKWSNGVQTHLGLGTEGFPNLIFLYGPQAPTSFCNGPTCAEVQGNWITQTLELIREKKISQFEVMKEAEAAWTSQVEAIGNATLLPQTRSEYMGTNVPGKKKQMLNYLGGLPLYTQQINDCLSHGLTGFTLTHDGKI